jgi:quinol monooxygenase YgiN
MFGTVGHVHFDPTNREELEKLLQDDAYLSVDGYRWAQLLFDENDPGHAVIVAVFEDRETYFRNADAPAQDERYRRMRAYLSEDPTWTDGEWSVVPSKNGPPQS